VPALVAASLALLVEGCALALALAERLTTAQVVMIHAGVTALLIGWSVIARVRGADAALVTLTALAVAVAGPFGALGAIALPRLSRTDPTDVQRLENWYRRLSLSVETDDLTRLSDKVAIGRALDLRAPAPSSFVRLVETGSVQERQAVLGLIARQFHPDYLPALKTALASAEPVVRVQAAAVAARVRGRLAQVVRRLLAEASAPDASAAMRDDHLRQARLCLECGLMEATDAVQAAEAYRRAAEAPAIEVSRVTGKRPAADPSVHEALEARLIEAGRFAEFRACRRVRYWAGRGRYRYRPLAAGARARPSGARA
jgi:hypothetical protein